jgi:hypothetical protein
MKIFISSLLFVLIAGCSSTEVSDNAVKREQVLYKLVAVAETEVDKSGDTCADAIGIVEFLHNKIVGSASDTFGRHYKISGAIDNNKKITGGFAITIITAVDFDGEMSLDGKKASGKWDDLYQCKGTWTATKLIKS